MGIARLKETFFRLPRHMKFIGIGSLILAVSTFLPWYADLDSYRIGDEFLGVTGPASFVGIAVLLLSALSFWIFSYHWRSRRAPRLPVREAILHMAVAVESLFLLLIVNSIYFHPKFGVNIMLKESRFGMKLSVIGAIILLVGAYISNKEEVAEEQGEGKLEPLIKIPPEPQARVNPASPPAYARPHTTQPQKPASPRPFLFGEGPHVQKKVDEKREEKGGGSYMIRTDL